MHTFVARALVIASLLFVAAGAGACRNRPATVHRATAVACSAESVKGNVEARAADAGPIDPRASCSKDADCGAGKNGRCAMAGGGRMAPVPTCIYDGCYADAECGGKSACECRGAPNEGHYCVGGNCATDADCSQGYCSPSLGSCGGYGGVEGNYCHTRADDCTNDDECTKEPGGYCAWKPEANEWQCSYSHCVG